MKDGIRYEQKACIVIQTKSGAFDEWEDFYEHEMGLPNDGPRQQERAMERFPNVRLIIRFTSTELLQVLK